jgi:toxin ParE1/3/4
VTHTVTFSPEARGQLLSLHDYIATKSASRVAVRFVDSIIAYCERLKHYPRRGTKRDDLLPGMRTVGFKRRATIAFLVDDETVTIIGVFYGGQDVDAAFRQSN